MVVFGYIFSSYSLKIESNKKLVFVRISIDFKLLYTLQTYLEEWISMFEVNMVIPVFTRGMTIQ